MGKHYFEENLTPEHPGMARHTSYNNREYQHHYKLIETGQIIDRGGLYGIKDKDGNLVYDCVYDQIEKGKDWIYFRKGLDYKIIYPTYSEEYYHDKEDFFVENGKMGWQKDGKIIVPAVYDYVDKASDDFEMYNVKENGKGRCINGEGMVILGDRQDEDDNLEVYLRTNNRNDVITQCMLEGEVGADMITSKDNDKVKLERTSCQVLEGNFLWEGAELPITRQALSIFNNKFSYEFSSYMANSFDEIQPIRKCFEKLEKMEFNDNSWIYIVKVEMHPSVKPSTTDINYLRTYFDKIEDVLGEPVIGFGFNPDLKEGETRVHMVTFYNEACFPPHFVWEWDDNSRQMSLEQIKETIPTLKQTILNEIVPGYQQSMWHDMMDSVIIGMRPSRDRNWKETEKVLNYFKECGAFYRHGLQSVTSNVFGREYHFYLNLMRWLVENGAELNELTFGKTVLDRIVDDRRIIEKRLKKDRNLGNCTGLKKKLIAFIKITEYLVAHGAKTASQIDKEYAGCNDYKLILKRFTKFDEDGWPCPSELV